MRFLLSRISFDGWENTSDGNLKSHLNGRPPCWRRNLDSMGSRSIKSRRAGSSRTRIVAITTRCSPCMSAVCLSGGVDTIRTLIAFLLRPGGLRDRRAGAGVRRKRNAGSLIRCRERALVSIACRRSTKHLARGLALLKDAVAVTPSDEDIDRPHPRPIHAGRPLEKGAPETLHCHGIEADRSDGLRIPQSPVHGVLQAAPNPAIQRQHETALRP